MEIVELAEKHRPSGGQARRAGVGEVEGDGEEPRVNGGDGIGESSLMMVGVALSAMVGVFGADITRTKL